jgi:filamentous hemagglutinin family protein
MKARGFVALAALAMASGADAGNILRRTNAPSPATDANAAAAAAAAAAAQQAALLQANSPLRQAMDAIKAYQDAQAAARAGAGPSSTVPNGLAPGGLQLAPGSTPIGASQPVQSQQGGITEVTITQNQQRAILDWNSFNVGAQTDVHFDQTAGGANVADWVALNRVVDPSAAPSQILGSIHAEGQVYVINRNGVIFGNGAQVNVHSLLVSGLDLAGPTEDARNQAFLGNALFNLAFAGPGGAVTVADGARINAAGFGRVVLLGSQVTNAGSIVVPDGQVVLAAGSSISLNQNPDLTQVRGLAPPTVSPDGLVENDGLISTPRGNITLVAADTRQNGLLNASTGAQANGSIYLGLDGFSTTFGGSSVTQILPDDSGVKLVGSASFVGSRVEVHGDKITLLDGARIYAPSGTVILSAVMTQQDPNDANLDDTRVYVGAGASIDVSGLKDVQVAMEVNSIQAQLRANELADDPLLRNNPALRGRTVFFDGRLGVDPGVANLSGYYDLIEHDVKELMTTGGTIQLAANQIIARQGSTLDLSGGSLQYQAGYVRDTVLIDPTGGRVAIENAVPGVSYVGINGDAVVNHARWGITETFASAFSQSQAHFETGYEQGGSAGTLSIGTNDPAWFTFNASAPRPPDPSATGAVRIFDGDVATSVIVGPKQRQAPSGTTDPTQIWQHQPEGATLQISRAGDVTFSNGGPQLAADFTATSTVDPAKQYQEVLPVSWFNGSGFNQVSIQSGFDPDSIQIPTGGNTGAGSNNRAPGGHLTLGAGTTLNFGDGGSFSFTGKSAEIDGTLLAPGGSVSFTTLEKDGTTPVGVTTLGASGVIDVAGRFTNDRLDGATAPVRALNGGSVSITAQSISLEAGSLIDVSGGAHLDGTGKSLTAGNGGSIKFDISRQPTPEEPDFPSVAGTLAMNGTLSGYALGRGGSLSLITGSAVVIGDALPAGNSAMLLTPGFFTRDGFASYSIVGESGITVAGGTQLAPSVETLVAPLNAPLLASGTRLDDVAARQVLPAGFSPPMSLSLSSVPVRTLPSRSTTLPVGPDSNDVDVEAGASIVMNPGSTVQLSSQNTLRIDGTVEAQGGEIDLRTPKTLAGVDASNQPVQSGGVVLGPDAQILAGGFEKSAISGPLVVHSVVAGGTVNISSATQVNIDPNAVIDVSGIHGVADLKAFGTASAPYVATGVDGSAGSISIVAVAGVVAGDLRLAAGGPSGVAGSLFVEKSGSVGSAPSMIVRQTAQPGAGGSLAVGSLTVVADSINASGANDVTLQAVPDNTTNFSNDNALLFEGNVTLHSNRSLNLVAPLLGTVLDGKQGQVTLSSSYVSLDGGSPNAAKVAGATDLTGTLTIRADTIDLSRTIVLGCIADPTCKVGGFGTTRFISSGDVRLSSSSAQGFTDTSPGLVSNGALSFEATQVYVTSREEGDAANGLVRAPSDPGYLVQSDQSISISRIPGAPTTPAVPLSFGERLTLSAPQIVQGGVLRAPAGEIILDGTGPAGSVTLLPGSITSSSLQGALVPFGAVQAGGTFLGYDQPGEAPAKSVTLNAPSVNVQKGAVIDVSGGGDLQGFLFVPGNGGSKDILSSSNGFAIVPSLGNAPAPVGGTPLLRDGRLQVGDSIFLQGVPGVKDGFYTLLPAHYALLPGGFLVEPMAGQYATAQPTVARPDGSYVASGFETFSGAPGYERFLLMPQQVVRQYSELDTFSFNQQAALVASQSGVPVRTPNDAGSVVLAATTSLALDGTGRFGAGPGGLAGDLDIAAPKIAVLSAGAAAPGPGFLDLDPARLSAFGAASILLGGTRSAGPGGTDVTVDATDVFVSTTAAAPWIAPEILLAATNNVTVTDGSVIRAQGSASQDASALNFTGDGAFLRLSSGARVPVNRADAPGLAGNLDIGAASIVAGSLTIEGAHGVGLSPAATLSAGQLDLASVRVNLGDAPAGAPGVTLSSQKLAELASASDLLIRGFDSIQIFGDVSLGSRDSSGAASLSSFTLDSGLIQGNGGNAEITAGNLTLRNSGGAGGAGVAGSGSFTLDVDQLHLGPGAVRLAGYGLLQGSATQIEADGAGSFSFAGNLSLATAQIQTGPGGSASWDIGGSASFTRAPGAPLAPTSLGGQLSLAAGSILLDTSIVLPSGELSATARGGFLQVGSDAVLDVSGAQVTFQDASRVAPGGSIQLGSAGDLGIAPGAVLDVAGPRPDSGGFLSFSAAGRASLQGTLHGGGGASFSLDAGTLDDFSGLAARILQGGFDQSVALRLRQQDLTLGLGDRIQAHQVSLQSDSGAVTIAGQIDATGSATSPDGGRIEIVGGAGVSLASTARLEASAGVASAGGFDPASGAVTLVATSGHIDAAPGSVIDVSGGRDGGGVIVARAPREGNDVAVDRFGSQIVGARQIVVQGTQAYTASTLDATLEAQMMGDATTWLAGAGTVAARLGVAGLQVAPAMTVTSAGDLAVVSDFDLSPLGAPGFLGLNAAGTIDLKANLSDGFAGTSRGAALLNASSFGIALASGLDLRLELGSMIRTGTGDISLQAGRDIVFAKTSSGNDTPAVVYTAGRASPADGFTGSATGAFPIDGGDIDLHAGRDISAPLPAQTTSAWLFRSGSTTWNGNTGNSTALSDTSWAVVFANFEQAVGALGGGDVRVTAGRNVSQLQVSIPTTGFLTTPPGVIPSAGDLVVRGGGDLSLTAFGDVDGGLFMLGRGNADVRAFGSVLPSADAASLRTTSNGGVFGLGRDVGVLFGLMDASATVTAGSSVFVEGTFDPMREGQVAANLINGGGVSWSGYTDRSSLSAVALGGPVTWENDPWAAADLSLGGKASFHVSMVGSGDTSLDALFGRAPPTLRLASLQSSIFLEDHFDSPSTLTLAPSDRGTLELLASGDVHLALATVTLEDVADNLRRGPLDPYSVNGDLANLQLDGLSTNNERGFTPTHAGDPEPVRIIAQLGSVCAQRTGECLLDTNALPTNVATPKPLEIYAGLDVMKGIWQPQNNGPDDITSIVAGRDLYEPGLQIDGPGSAVLQAGRNIVLNQYSNGGVRGGSLFSLGNGVLNGTQINQALPGDKGADLYLLAGAANGVDWNGFAAAYLDPDNGHGVVQTYLPQLARYLQGMGFGPMSDQQAVATFASLPLLRREVFLDQVYFTELQQTGIDYNTVGGPRFQSYNRGFTAVSLLFPANPASIPADQRGDVILNARSVETQVDANIEILAPYGSVAVGAASLPKGVDPTSGGVVTRRGGSIDIMSDGNIDLFTSRVFTLEGGDIAMWTSDGSITAGSGSKTSVFQKPLSYVMDNEAVIDVNAFGLQTGAGIGVLDALLNAADRQRSRLDLIAPRGEVNAGDAGIRAVGDLNIAAAAVVGVENIQASGSVSGVPKVEGPNIGALTSASSVAQAATKEGVGPEAQPRTAVADLPSIITVEVVGYETTDESKKKKDKE